MKIVSWNVNGLEACRRKGFLKFLSHTKPDVVCCQETKVSEDFEIKTPGYSQIWNHGKFPGYSGTLVLTKPQPLSLRLGMGIEKFDNEGRLITAEYEDYYVVNVYVPSIHTYSTPDRPEYRYEWDIALQEYIKTLEKPIILCGDFNVKASALDTYPHQQESEIEDALIFQPEMQAAFEALLGLGLVDVFLAKYPHKADYCANGWRRAAA